MKTLHKILQRKKSSSGAAKALQFSGAVSPLDDPQFWLREAAYNAPISLEQIESVQREIDGILGTTRGGKAIGKLVWNGDRKYWKEYYTDWNVLGKPKGELYRRPHVLYKTIQDKNGKFIRDAFPPRFLILTRIEPEQYVKTWANDSKIYSPEHKCDIQIKPEQPPAEMHIWFQTIARHNSHCCASAAKYGADCYGFYVHPRYALDGLREIRKGIEDSGLKNTAFDAPDEMSRQQRERSVTNYHGQAMKRFAEQARYVASEMPLASAPVGLVEGGASLKKIREVVSEIQKRQLDDIEQKLK